MRGSFTRSRPRRRWSPGDERVGDAREKRRPSRCGRSCRGCCRGRGAPAARTRRRRAKRLLVRSRRARCTVSAGKSASSAAADASRHLAADVDRHVARLLAAGGPGAQQVARLARVARAQLDERARPDIRAQRDRVRREQRVLGAREIVLRLARDGLEQRAALGVVEVAAREPARRVAQPADDRLRERRARQLAVTQLVARHARTASRMAAPTSASVRDVWRGKIVCTDPAPSFGQRGTMCT